jgi:hypothetical protein
MNEKSSKSELLKRKFDPVSDWKPASETARGCGGRKSFFQETLEEAQKRGESFGKTLEPFTEDAKAKIKELAVFLEETAGKSSNEARSFLAKTLESLAGKIKPGD